VLKFDENNAYYLNFYVQEVPVVYISSLVLTFLKYILYVCFFCYFLFFFFITERQQCECHGFSAGKQLRLLVCIV